MLASSSAAATVGIYAIVVPALLFILGGLVHLSIRFGRLEGRVDEHLADHSDGPRTTVWPPPYRRRRTGHP